MVPEFWHQLSYLWKWFLITLELSVLVLALGHVILRQQDARAAAFWAAIITFVPLLGGAFYSLFGINRLRRRGREYRISATRDKSAVDKVVPVNPFQKTPELSTLRRLAATLSRISRYDFTIGNRVTVLRNGDEAMPAMLDAICSAQRSIALCSYIFEARGIGEKFITALDEAKTRGVQVRVMVDDAGTRYSWPAVTRILAQRGITAARFMPHRFFLRLLTMNLRNHRKFLIVDGHIGFTGGINIRQGNMLSENPSSPVRDMHFRVDGPIVQQLQRSFAEDWAFCHGEILQGDLWYPGLQPCGDVAAIGVPDGPDEDLEVMPKAIFAALISAHHQVRVMTPYFLPEKHLVWAMTLAALRGVDVQVITPRANNIPPVRWAARTIYPFLLEKGVKIYESDGPFDHTKFMTVDGMWSLIGSTNWDPRSFRLNFEFNVACFDEALAKNLNAEFQDRLGHSKAVTQEQLSNASLGERMRDGIARMFIPVL